MKQSKYLGVHWITRDRKWQARINSGSSLSGEHVNLGYHNSEKDAARAFDNSGEFKAGYKMGRLNKHRFPEDFPGDPEAGTVEAVVMSEYQGVSFFKRRMKFKAEITATSSTTGKLKYIGLFESEVEAARAYDTSVFLKEDSPGWRKRNITKYPDLY